MPDSTAEAETAQGSKCTKRVIYNRAALRGVGRAVFGPTYICCDNSAMYHLVVKEGTSQRTRHFERATVLIKFAVIRLMVRCVLVPTTAMIADIFTKPVDEETFYRMRDIMRNLAVWVPEPTAKVNRLLGALRRAMSVGSFS